jgi:hypothetical protein
LGLVGNLKDLNAMVSGIHDIHTVFRVRAEPSRRCELSWLLPALAKSEQQLSLAIEYFDPVESWNVKTTLSIEWHSCRLTLSAAPQSKLPPEVTIEIQNLNSIVPPIEYKHFALVDCNFNGFHEFGRAASAAPLPYLGKGRSPEYEWSASWVR